MSVSTPTELRLSNGIPVILQHSDGSAAATYWWNQVGSADEHAIEAGFAHFLEHMLFKDSAAKDSGKASTGQMAQSIEGLGGDINAYTSFDQTVYHVTCAAYHWEKVITEFGVIASQSKFLKEDFDREREVILEELKKNEDSPSRQLFQALFTGAFKKHPYGKPVIGYVKTLKAAKLAWLEKFYKNNYRPERMGIVMVGPTQGKEAKIMALLEKCFGSKVIKKVPPLERPKRVTEPELRAQPSFEYQKFDVSTPNLAMAFRAPDLKSPKIAALDVASSVLSMGELGRLYQSLFYKESLVTDISGGLYVPWDAGMFYVQAEFTDFEKASLIVRKIVDEMLRLKEEGPTAEELSRIIANSESERLYAQQTVDGIASRLGFLRFVMDDLSYDHRYLAALKDVSVSDVKAAAQEFFIPERLAIVLQAPKTLKDHDALKKKHEKMILAEVKRLAAAPVAKKVARAKPAQKKRSGLTEDRVLGEVPMEWTTPSGMRVIYRERKDSHAFSVHTSALGGLRLEGLDSWGASYLMALSYTKGTKRTGKTAQDIARVIEGRAAGLDAFSGRNTVGVSMTGLKKDFSELSALFSEVLVDPSFEATELEHSKRVAEDTIKGIEDHTSQLCSKLFLEALFEKHPYGRLPSGSMEVISKLTPQNLLQLKQQWMRPERMVLSVVGGVSEDQARSLVHDIESGLQSLAPALGTPPSKLVLTDEPALKAPRWVQKALGREQVHIISGSLGIRITDPERMALLILETILGGQSGRLFIELREKQSLAYTVAPMSFEGIERGYVGTYIACSPDKKDQAIEGIQVVLEKLAKKGPTPAEMKRAFEYYLGRKAMDLQSDASLASHYGLEAIYGVSGAWMEALSRVTAKDVQKVCEKYFVNTNNVTAVVG